MATMISLQRRIKTAQNVSKTTQAMQMIAASRLKRAQEAALASRPYVEKLSQITRSITNSVDNASKPIYMKERKATGKTLLVLISPDKGLCGGLVTNLAREVLKRNGKNDILLTIGKKAEGIALHLENQLIASFPSGNTLPSFGIVYPIVKIIDEYFIGKKVDRVEVLSTKFVNMFTQQSHFTALLPVTPEAIEGKENPKFTFQLFEPDFESILPELLKQYIEMVLYQEILESYLSEQSARMIAMQNATTNAKDIIEVLRLEYNKSRQAKITSEILDISVGALAQ